MTTIATDGKSMASDGLVNCGGTITDTAYPKLTRLLDGSILGFSGSIYDIPPFIEWMENGKGWKLEGLSEHFCVLHLTHDGVFSYDNKGSRVAEPHIAVTGSGGDFALAAMDMGASPAEAVRLACARDIHSGGEIMTLELQLPISAVA